MSHRPYSQLEMEPLYGFSHALIEIVYDICFRGDIAGRENLNLPGGFIVAANHASLLDPPIVGLFLARQVSFFARKTLWKPGIAARWLDGVGTIPVDRDGGFSLGAIKRVLQALAQGRAVILFPEGTRSPDDQLQKPKSGIRSLSPAAPRSRSCRRGSLVPLRLWDAGEGCGSAPRFQSPIGRPLLPEAYDNPSDGDKRYPLAAERIMAAIARLAPPIAPVI